MISVTQSKPKEQYGFSKLIQSKKSATLQAEQEKEVVNSREIRN